MPLVRIDTLDGYSPDQRAAMGEGVHAALVETMGVPPLDRFQVIAAHAPGALVFDAEYLGIARTPGVVFVQITLNGGRTVDQKRALYGAIARNLAARPGVRPEDVLVNLVEVTKENWSFGNGVAPYAT
ncbi:MAG: tautomerase family protein [Thermoanaerobaculia bacterium]